VPRTVSCAGHPTKPTKGIIMNLLKSIFISSYMMAIMGVTGFAGWMLLPEPNKELLGML
jgi:hypothetical protein